MNKEKLAELFKHLFKRKKSSPQEDEFTMQEPTPSREEATPKKSDTKKVVLAAAAVGVLAVGGYTFMGFGDNRVNVATQKAGNVPIVAKQDNDKKTQGNEPTTKQDMFLPNMDNPFVAREVLIKTLALNEDNGTTTVLPTIPAPAPARTYVAPQVPPTTTTRILPPIPQIPSSPVSVSQIPQPAPNIPAAAVKSVQGTASDSNGNSIAIMSDGSVVENGETFNDRRIAFIGGDGVKFGDGSSLTYKESE